MVDCVLTSSEIDCADPVNGGDPTNWNIDPVSPNFIEVGNLHHKVCVIDSGQLKCSNDGSFTNVSPSQCSAMRCMTPTLNNVRDISIGWRHACAIDDEQGVVCWGFNNAGQATVPDNLVNPRQVVAGLVHTCALTDNGVICWGAQLNPEANPPDEIFIDPDGDGVSTQNGQDKFPLDPTRS